MILKSKIVLISIFCLYIISCTFENGENTKSSEKDITAIKKFLEQSGEAVNNGDVEAEVNRFTEDGIYMWPDAPSIIGHDSLRIWFQLRFEKVDVNIKNVSEELEICDKWAFECGRYIAKIQPKRGGELVTIRGKYLNILRKQSDGLWKISHRIRNRDHKTNQP